MMNRPSEPVRKLFAFLQPEFQCWPKSKAAGVHNFALLFDHAVSFHERPGFMRSDSATRVGQLMVLFFGGDYRLAKPFAYIKEMSSSNL
jgi:hypothetical protein